MDNGIGYEKKEISGRPGMGLKNIQSRVAKLNGHFHVDSGLGTTSIIEIPLQDD